MGHFVKKFSQCIKIFENNRGHQRRSTRRVLVHDPNAFTVRKEIKFRSATVLKGTREHSSTIEGCFIAKWVR
jgi:hypothetical protein